MKTIIKGMTLLLAGVMVMSCSKDVTFDENAQKQAKIEQQFAQYEANFVKRFGSIAPTQDWGFGDEAKGIITTRGEAFEGSGRPVDCGYDVPNSITSNKNGNFGNKAADQFNNKKGYTSTNFVFDNYWVQHVNTPEGANSNMLWLEAYDSSVSGGRWIKIEGFESGKNENQLYFQTNSKTHGTTLMTNMGGEGCNGSAANGGDEAKGKFFRWKGSDGYHYDYQFLDYVRSGSTYFLVGFPIKKNQKTLWWIVLIEKATPKVSVVEEGRIMCEDLGDTDDFDFNDVVFDARRYSNGSTEITLVAAGGELPITVAGVDVHAQLGSMSNTGVNEGDTYTFTVNGYTSILEIPVVVYPDGIGVDAVKYQLNAAIGSAPQKICTPRGSHYAEEYIDINRAYSDFSTWVQNDNPAADLWVENTRLTDLILSTK